MMLFMHLNPMDLIVLSHNSVRPDFILCVDITILGMQHSVILAAQPYGLGLNETLLPQHLQKLGYATHAVGKVSGVLLFVVHILHDDLNLERLTMSKGPEES